MSNLAAIVPFYNEEKFLRKSVKRLIDEKIFDQIILVDDCSNDSSSKIAHQLASEYRFIILIENIEQKGKGYSIKQGLNKVETSHVIVHDADLEYFPSDIVEMFEIAKDKNKSLVLGSRTIGTKERINLYKRNYIVQMIFSNIFSILNFKKISDIATCYWLIETKILRKFSLKESGFSIEVEVLSKSIQNKLEIIEIPIKYHGRSYEDGKKIKFKDGLIIFFKIVTLSRVFRFFGKSQIQ